MISTYAPLLVKGYRGQIEGEAALCLNYVTEGAERMRDLLADLLAYTRVNADTPPVAGLLTLVFHLLVSDSALSSP